MSNDNKTLADAQPGGRVRLGDQARVAMSEDDFANMVETVAGEHGEMLEDGGPYNGWCFSCEELIDFSRGIITGWDWERRAQEYARAALSAQPSPGGQGDARDIIAEFVQCADAGRPPGKLLAQARDFLAARQPSQQPDSVALGEATEFCIEKGGRQPVGEPVGYACTNCDRTDEVVICQTCAGMAWDNGRLHEFHEVRELSTSLGEGVLDHLLPDEWHEKPLLRFQGAFDEGDRSVGIGERCGNVLAADQSGTVLGDYLAARAAKEGGQ